MEIIKIAIVDDQLILINGLESLIKPLLDINVIMTALSGKKFIDKLENCNQLPDIVLLDIDMPEMNGIQTLAVLNEKYPSIKAIMLSFHSGSGIILRLIELGAVGYLVKDSSFCEVKNTIRNVYKYGRFFNPEIADLLQKRISNKNNSKLILEMEDDYLTIREKEVLELICQQKSNNEIAENLKIGIRTVESHRAVLMKKAKAENIVGLVFFAISRKILHN